MKATLMSESYRTGPMIIKFYLLNEPVVLENSTEPVTTLQLSYNYDSKTCKVQCLDFNLEQNEEKIYQLDIENDDVFSQKTDRQMLAKFLNISNHRKIEIETDCSVFEEY